MVGIAERVSQTRPKITPFDEFPPPIMREQPNFMVLAYVRSLRNNFVTNRLEYGTQWSYLAEPDSIPTDVRFSCG